LKLSFQKTWFSCWSVIIL